MLHPIVINLEVHKAECSSSQIYWGAMQVASRSNTYFVASLLEPVLNIHAGMESAPGLLDEQAITSKNPVAIPAVLLDPQDPAENEAVSTDRQACMSADHVIP